MKVRGHFFLHIVFFSLMCLLITVAPALAQEGGDIDRARQLFKQGTAHAEEDRWEQALRAFEASAELLEHASTTYNIGYCERGLGHYTRAQRAFRRALAQDQARGGELTADQKTAAARYLEEASKVLAKLRVTLRPADLHISIDGRPLSVTGETVVAGIAPLGPPAKPPAGSFTVIVDPGKHTIEVTDKARGNTSIVDMKPGEERAVVLTIEPVPDGSEPQTPETDPIEELRTTHFGWAIGIGSAAVVVGVVGGVLTGVAAGTWSDAQDACPEIDRCPNDMGFELSNDASMQGRLATAAFVTAGAAAAGALVLWLTAPDAPEGTPEISVRAGPTGAALRVRF